MMENTTLPSEQNAPAAVKHHGPTPGPWSFEADYGSEIKGLVYASDLLVADCLNGNGAQDEANARLIAAAPDMLDALYEARDFVDDRAEVLAQTIDAAIAKAVGDRESAAKRGG